MSSTLYQATVLSFLQVLPPLGGLVEKARAYAADKNVSDATLLDARLADDMWPFAKQVMAAIAHSAGAIEGVQMGETGPISGEMPTSLAALGEAVASAINVLEAIASADLDGIASNDTCFRFGNRTMPFTVDDYLLTFAVPNFYFHASMAYAILRNQGVGVGKMDFLGAVRMKLPAAID